MNNIKIGKRIMVIGSPGSGKSTFSRQLAELTGMPLIHLDKEFWNPGWVETSKDEWVKKHETLIAGDMWIIDGDYSGTLEKRLERADTVIHINLNKLICLISYLKRAVNNYGTVRPDMTEGCIEKIEFEFIKYIWNFTETSGQKNKERFKRYPNKNFIVFKKCREAKNFLKILEKNKYYGRSL